MPTTPPEAVATEWLDLGTRKSQDGSASDDGVSSVSGSTKPSARPRVDTAVRLAVERSDAVTPQRSSIFRTRDLWGVTYYLRRLIMNSESRAMQVVFQVLRHFGKLAGVSLLAAAIMAASMESIDEKDEAANRNSVEVQDHAAAPKVASGGALASPEEYEESIGTAEQRAELAALDRHEMAVVFEELASAFSGVAEIRPGGPDALTTSAGPMMPILAYGWDRDHYWVTASYADMSRGAIWGAVHACKRSGKAPHWLCQYAGDKLSEWARGWGSANNHGVWGTLHPYQGRLTGGRW